MRILRNLKKVMILARIMFQVKELRTVRTVVHILVLLKTDHEHGVGDAVGMVFAEGKVLMAGIFSCFHEGAQALSVQTSGNRKPHIVADRREPVCQVHRRFYAAGLPARKPDDHGHMGGFLKHAAFPPKAVIAQLFSVIAGITEDYLILKSQGVHLVKKDLQTLVQLGDGAVVADEKFPYCILRQAFTLKIGAKPVQGFIEGRKRRL